MTVQEGTRRTFRLSALDAAAAATPIDPGGTYVARVKSPRAATTSATLATDGDERTFEVLFDTPGTWRIAVWRTDTGNERVALTTVEVKETQPKVSS